MENRRKEIILKVKDKFVNCKDDFIQGEMYIINVDFESYCIDNIEKPIKGYYCKVLGVKKVEMCGEVDDDSNYIKKHVFCYVISSVTTSSAL